MTTTLNENTIRIAPDGTPWWVLAIFKKKVRIRTAGQPRISLPVEEVEAWEEAEIPQKLSVGDKVYRGKDLVTVSGFHLLGSSGRWVALKGRWGFGEGHEHENLTPFNQSSFLAEMIYKRPNLIG